MLVSYLYLTSIFMNVICMVVSIITMYIIRREYKNSKSSSSRGGTSDL